MKTPVPSWEVVTKPLPGNPIFTLYQLFVNGRLVRAQISAFSAADLAWARSGG